MAAGLAGALAVAPPAFAQAPNDDTGCLDASLEPTPQTIPRVEAAMVCLINVERSRAGLAAFAVSGRLDQSAEFHSRDMVSRRFFAHEMAGRPSLVDRIKASGYFESVRYGLYSENIGVGPEGNASAAALVRAWMDNPGHRANILRPELRDLGIGSAQSGPQPVFYADYRSTVYTTDFGRRYSTRPAKRCKRRRSSSPPAAAESSAQPPRGYCRHKRR